MDAAHALRAARRHARVSQRELARRAGLPASAVADVESGRHSPSVRQLDRLLEAVGLELALDRRLPDEPCRHLRAHLRLSLTARLEFACTGPGELRGCGRRVRLELAALARSGQVTVCGPAAVGVWVPGAPAASLLPCQVVLRPGSSGPPAGSAVRWVAVPAPPGSGGLVAVPVSADSSVHVPAPDELALDPACAVHRRSLRAAARLLHAEAVEDQAGRRAAAHRDPDHAAEAEFVAVNRRLGGSGGAPVEDGRAWRLGGPASRDDWLRDHGYDV